MSLKGGKCRGSGRDEDSGEPLAVERRKEAKYNREREIGISLPTNLLLPRRRGGREKKLASLMLGDFVIYSEFGRKKWTAGGGPALRGKGSLGVCRPKELKAGKMGKIRPRFRPD
jgi:hypothetical protein